MAAILRVIERSCVSPPPGSAAQPSLPLTFFDIIHLDDPPTQLLFFYRFPDTTTTHSIPNLKSSLSLTLHRFFPFAGTLRPSPASPNHLEIRYTAQDSVPFVVAESEGDFDEIVGSSRARSFAGIHQLTPQLPGGDAAGPLLSIQVTLFPCQGICIGTAFHHVVADGSSILHLMASWTDAYSSGEVLLLPTPPPSYDRTLLAGQCGLYSLLQDQLLTSRASSRPRPYPGDLITDDLVYATFALRRDHLHRLRQRVAPNRPLSTFVLACAYVWVCLVKSRHNNDTSTTAHFIFVADCRQSMRLPAYFGNCVWPCFAEAKVGDLIGKDSFLVASEAIGDTMDKFSGRVLEDAEQWLPRIQSLRSNKFLSVAGSPKLMCYSIDFGWGRPEKVMFPFIHYTQAISLSESRDELGGVEIGFVLPEKEMDVFGAHFADGLHHSRF